MPTFGGATVPEGTSAPFAGVEARLDLDGLVSERDVVFDAFPLTFDESISAWSDTGDPVLGEKPHTLRDIVQGNEWRLRRIVGKAFLIATQDAVASNYSAGIDCAVGFIVCKTFDDGFPLTNFAECNPLSREAAEDPWIWRRRWLLHPGGPVNPDPLASNLVSPWKWGLPQNTMQYGSVADGPHIDQKTARVIHRSERLFCVIAARRYYPIGDSFPTMYLRALIDYRLLGSLRGSAIGNRGNASR